MMNFSNVCVMFGLPMYVEPTGFHHTGICPCCGRQSLCIWGFVHTKEGTLACYYVHWTVGHVEEMGANIDLIIGRWGDGASADDRVVASFQYALAESSYTVDPIDSAGRPCADGDLATTILGWKEVADHPLARHTDLIIREVLRQDHRANELLPAAVRAANRRPWWKFW